MIIYRVGIELPYEPDAEVKLFMSQEGAKEYEKTLDDNNRLDGDHLFFRIFLEEIELYD